MGVNRQLVLFRAELGGYLPEEGLLALRPGEAKMDASGQLQLGLGVVRDRPGDQLTAWARRRVARPRQSPAVGRVRFAFYGRVPTEDRQDPVTSRTWQLRRVQATMAGHGQILAQTRDRPRSGPVAELDDRAGA